MDSLPTPITESPFVPPPAAAGADQRACAKTTPYPFRGEGTIQAASAVPSSSVERKYQNQLVQARLGLASSLFAALRARNAATAAHCLRVALGCSSWGRLLNLENPQRDELEVAALLHDIGKIGIPDRVLLKPDSLTREERATLDQRRVIGEQILLSCCVSQEVLSIVKYAPAWYDGTRPGFDRRGQHLPLGARVVSILDAYDAMTTQQVYRRAMSRDWATAELFACAGTQFDPTLVEQFCDSLSASQVSLSPEISRRWLRELSFDRSNNLWRWPAASLDDALDMAVIDSLFHEKLLDSMHDGVIFVDTQLNILLWNRAAEQLTGLAAAEVLHQRWSSEFIGMRNEKDLSVDVQNSPVHLALNSRIQTLHRLTVNGRNKERLSVDVHAVPVIGRDGIMHGATLLLHDASTRINLEKRVQTLHMKATRDPLTKVANRAEFDRVHAEFVENHQGHGRPCALIMCDIDHFKNVNDTVGHQVGDEVLVCFVAILQRYCRQGDLVARYGGDEFVMLCADCDNAAVTHRAENIRHELEMTPHECLDNRPFTASFGVTEIQDGDIPETMLRRADRALLRAKESGRNRVVQLGTGIPHNVNEERPLPWRRWFHPRRSTQVLEETLVTAVPLAVAMEKLRGFVSDHHAEIVATEDGKLQLQITKQTAGRRGSAERPISLLVSLRFVKKRVDEGNGGGPGTSRTMIHVAICLANNRDRRRANAYKRARQLFASLKSYFMAQTFEGIFDPIETKMSPTFIDRLLAILRRWCHASRQDPL
jgi:diguanylate cyclase (GGDEF)-like protein/PAS domain S-box-containing protein